MSTPSDNDLRKMRDRIYGRQTEKEWQHCRDNWSKDGQWQWLVEQNAKLIVAEVNL